MSFSPLSVRFRCVALVGYLVTAVLMSCLIPPTSEYTLYLSLRQATQQSALPYMDALGQILWPLWVTVRLVLPFGLAFLVWLFAVHATMRLTIDRSNTRCRRCAYVLRGLAVPRCPECGERV